MEPIRSLPPWHGARWNALLRLAARKAGLAPDAAFIGIAPQRSGQAPWVKGENVALRIFFDADNPDIACRLLEALRKFRFTEGEFCLGSNLVFHGFLAGKNIVCDTLQLTEQPIENAMQEEGVFSRLTPELLEEEISLLARLDAWTLQCIAPLRLTLPPGAKGAGGEQARFAQPDFFHDSTALDCLVSRIRWLQSPPDMPSHGAGLLPTKVSLRWNDMAYSRERHMRIGGLTGMVAYKGRVDPRTAAALVFGQYCGTGKNARFGFGMYRIPELDGVRKLPAYPE
jgi:hypothetical protein